MSYSDLKIATDLLIEKPCWLVIAGKGTGSIVHLGFGEKNLRDRPLKNTCISEEERLFYPDISLMIYCAWRLSLADKILCGWRSSNKAGGEMLSGLLLLKSKSVTDVVIYPLGFDLELIFEGDLRLQIFCDITTNDEADNNYELFTMDKIIEVGVNRVGFTPRNSNAVRRIP